MSQNDDFVGVVDVGLVQSCLFKRTTIHEVHLLEPGNRVPNLRVNLVSSSLIRLSSDDHNLLQLVLFQVLLSERHDKVLDC
jgi:hypothetical protein